MPRTLSQTYQVDRWRVGPSHDGTATEVRLTLIPPPAPQTGSMFTEFGATQLEWGGLSEIILPGLVRGLAVTVTLTVPDDA